MKYQLKTKIPKALLSLVLSLSLSPAAIYGMGAVRNIATTTVQGVGNIALWQAGLMWQAGSMAAQYGLKGANYAIGKFPKTSAVAALYLLAVNNGKNAQLVGEALQKLELGNLANVSLHKITEIPGKAFEHLKKDNNAAVAATLLAPFIIKYAWDETCEWIGDNKITEKFIVMAKETPLAGWCYGSHKHACNLYQDFMYQKDDSLLRKQFIQEHETGSINGWKFKEGDIQPQLLEEIARECALLQQLKEEAIYYVPNGKLALKICREYANIFDRRRWCSTTDKEDTYCDLILKSAFPIKDDKGKVVSGPDKAKANTWHELFWKDNHNIFWRRYRYWGKALILYAEIENRLERLEALEIIVKYELPKWWTTHPPITVSVQAEPAIVTVSGNPLIVVRSEKDNASEQEIVA